MDASRLKYCRLHKGKEVPDICIFYLQYACYAESFYCTATQEQDEDCLENMKFYNVSTSAYNDIPTTLLAHLFTVWMNKLAGGSDHKRVVTGFHDKFMKAYLSVDQNGLMDMWLAQSNYSKSWAYYLDKCIYFKGTAFTPENIVKAGKQEMFRYEYEWVMMHYPSDDEYITKHEQDGYLKEMIGAYKQAGLSHYRQDDGIAISLKAYLFSVRGSNIEAFKQWYETEYYSSAAFSPITKDYLLRLTHYYKGEDECPAAIKAEDRGKIWLAESVAVDEILSSGNALSKAWGYELYKMVAIVLPKWCPYDYKSVLDLYLQDFVDFKMKVLGIT